MIINIISVGKLSPGYRDLGDHYCKMIKWKIKETELNSNKKLSENQAKTYEAKLINNYININSYRIVLDVQGQQLNSQEFSLLFKKQMMIGQNIDIIVGGAFGLDDSITKSAHIRLSLSKMTLPHQLAKLVLLEQIYRSQTILAAHPYHK
jgi:23S rRNA (pseudouridine1915-N3)-methyltransferase